MRCCLPDARCVHADAQDGSRHAALDRLAELAEQAETLRAERDLAQKVALEKAEQAAALRERLADAEDEAQRYWQSLAEMTERLAEAERERDEWLEGFDGDGMAWHEGLPSPYTYQRSDFTKLVTAVHAYEARALAAEERLAEAEFMREQWKEAAESQAKESVWWNRAELAERQLAEVREALRAIVAVPSEHDLLLNAVGRAMYEYARRALASLEGGEEG